MEERTYEAELAMLAAGDFSGLRKELSEWNEVDIADFLEELEPKDMIKVFRILPKDISAEVFSYLEADNQESIVASITNKELRNLVDDLYLDGAPVADEVVVIGGGLVGAETALQLGKEGKEVTIVEMLSDIVLQDEPLSQIAMKEGLAEANVTVPFAPVTVSSEVFPTATVEEDAFS